MKIGIIGSRRRNFSVDYKIVEKAFLEIYKEGDIIVSGGCFKGGDKFAEDIADKYSIPKKIFPADWNKYGKAAGFIRNTDIAKYSDILLALVAVDRKGGTEDTIEKFNNKHPNSIVILL